MEEGPFNSSDPATAESPVCWEPASAYVDHHPQKKSGHLIHVLFLVRYTKIKTEISLLTASLHHLLHKRDQTWSIIHNNAKGDWVFCGTAKLPFPAGTSPRDSWPKLLIIVGPLSQRANYPITLQELGRGAFSRLRLNGRFYQVFLRIWAYLSHYFEGTSFFTSWKHICYFY